MMFARVGLIQPRPPRVFIHFVASLLLFFLLFFIFIFVQSADGASGPSSSPSFGDSSSFFHRLNRGESGSVQWPHIKTETVLPPTHPPSPGPVQHLQPPPPVLSPLLLHLHPPLYHLHLLVGFLTAIPIHRSL